MQTTTYTPAERAHTCQACTLADAMKICRSCQFYTQETETMPKLCQCTEAHETNASQCTEPAATEYNAIPMCKWCAEHQPQQPTYILVDYLDETCTAARKWQKANPEEIAIVYSDPDTGRYYFCSETAWDKMVDTGETDPKDCYCMFN